MPPGRGIGLCLRQGGKVTDFQPFDPLFRRWERGLALGEEDKRALLALPWTRRNYARDSYFMREGEPTTICSLLLTGFAFRQKLLSDGARQIISFHIPGEFLDIQNLVLGTADHNVQALSRCSMTTVPKELLMALMEARPAIGRAIWRDALIDASVFREWVVNVGRRDARERIAHLLCEFAARIKAAGLGNETQFDFPLTQEQIADATGLTAVHTNRTLQALRKGGLISLSQSRLEILDWDALCAVGDFTERYLHEAV